MKTLKSHNKIVLYKMTKTLKKNDPEIIIFVVLRKSENFTIEMNFFA